MSYKTLDQHIEHLLKLQAAGHGQCKMVARHSASGAAYPVSNPHVTNLVESAGPFDLEPGEYYVSVSVGH